MILLQLLEQIKKHPDFHRAGMILCHNGIVRGTSRDGRKVSGLRVAVDHQKLNQIIDSNKKLPGILEILVHINEDKDLRVGEDVMYLVVAGDFRENVISALQNTLNEIKSTVTQKTEYFCVISKENLLPVKVHRSWLFHERFYPYRQ
jgi:molybdopterin synthase catalytic subunit